MATAFLNGEFVELADAKVSALDAGLQHGVGVFDTMLGGVLTPEADDLNDDLDDSLDSPSDEPAGVQAWVLDMEDHLERLATSCRELGLSEDLSTDGLGRAVLETVRRSGLKRARVRLTVTGGPLNLLRRDPGSATSKPATAAPSASGQLTILIVASMATEYPETMLSRGVMAVVADTKANPFNQYESHKTLNYWWRLRELQIAAAKGAGEALVFSVTNHLCGGCVSSALLVKDGIVRTPIARGEEGASYEPGMTDPVGTDQAGGVKFKNGILPSAVLPGIARKWAIRQLATEGVVVKRSMLTVTDILEADELLLTNSSWGVLPVVQLEGKQIGAGKPGPIATQLIAAWRDELASPPVWG